MTLGLKGGKKGLHLRSHGIFSLLRIVLDSEVMISLSTIYAFEDVPKQCLDLSLIFYIFV